MNFTDAPAPVNFPKLIKCRRARRPNMVRDGSKKWHFFKAGLHALMPHTILPPPPKDGGHSRREKKDSFPHERATCGSVTTGIHRRQAPGLTPGQNSRAELGVVHVRLINGRKPCQSKRRHPDVPPIWRLSCNQFPTLHNN
jgi:hypothetical protein